MNDLKIPDHHQFIKDDVRTWLKHQLRAEKPNREFKKMDLIICDPPTFSTTKTGGIFSVENEWRLLADACHKISSPHADFLFCTNHRHGNKNLYRQILEEVFPQVLTVPAPLDFPVLDETQEHVKMFWCRRESSRS